MSKLNHTEVLVKHPFSVEIFDKTGMPSNGENAVFVLGKLTTSTGDVSWEMIHMN
ncbi:hypothetical protein GYB22_06950 [bacterium]|nr:hypothetical protein [bacterium]